MAGVSDRSNHKDIPSTLLTRANLYYGVIQRYPITRKMQHLRSEDVEGNYSAFGGRSALYLRVGTRVSPYPLTAIAILAPASIWLAIPAIIGEGLPMGREDSPIIYALKMLTLAIYFQVIVMFQVLALSAAHLYKTETFQDRWRSSLIHSLITVFCYWLGRDSEAGNSWHMLSRFSFSVFLFELAPQLRGQNCLSMRLLIHTFITVFLYWLWRDLGALAFLFIIGFLCVVSCLGYIVFFFGLAAQVCGQYSPIYVDWKEIRFPYFRKDKGAKQL